MYLGGQTKTLEHFVHIDKWQHKTTDIKQLKRKKVTWAALAVARNELIDEYTQFFESMLEWRVHPFSFDSWLAQIGDELRCDDKMHPQHYSSPITVETTWRFTNKQAALFVD